MDMKVFTLDNIPRLTSWDLDRAIASGLPPTNGRRVLLIVPDHTRPFRRFEVQLLDAMLKLYGNGMVDIAVATGQHRQSTMDELREKFGKGIDNCVIYQNNPIAPYDWIKALKRDEGYYVIAYSNPLPHNHVGMSGGNKLVCPGLSSAYQAIMFHEASPAAARNKAKFAASEIVDYWIGCSYDTFKYPTDVYFTSSKDNFDDWVIKIKDNYKIKIPDELPEVAILEPKIKNEDFILSMNSLLVAKNYPIVKEGGTICIISYCPDGAGVHYLFQRGNGMADDVFYDRVFAAELKNRTLAFITHLPERAIRKFFKFQDLEFYNDIEGLYDSMFYKYGNEIKIHHYIAPEIMIGEK